MFERWKTVSALNAGAAVPATPAPVLSPFNASAVIRFEHKLERIDHTFLKH